MRYLHFQHIQGYLVLLFVTQISILGQDQRSGGRREQLQTSIINKQCKRHKAITLILIKGFVIASGPRALGQLRETVCEAVTMVNSERPVFHLNFKLNTEYEKEGRHQASCYTNTNSHHHTLVSTTLPCELHFEEWLLKNSILQFAHMSIET